MMLDIRIGQHNRSGSHTYHSNTVREVRECIKNSVEAAGGLEPPNKGFADLCLSHLATPP